MINVGPAFSMDQMAYSHAQSADLDSGPVRYAKGTRSASGDARSARLAMRLPEMEGLRDKKNIMVMKQQYFEKKSREVRDGKPIKKK